MCSTRPATNCGGAARSCPIEARVFELLTYLIRNRERVVSQEDLRMAVWEGRIVSISTISSSLNAVRTAIGDSGDDQRFIRTVPRKGFRFVAPVAEEPTGGTPTTNLEAAGSAAGPMLPAAQPAGALLRRVDVLSGQSAPPAIMRRQGHSNGRGVCNRRCSGRARGDALLSADAAADHVPAAPDEKIRCVGCAARR